MIRPYLTRLVSTRVPIVRTFGFTPKIFVGGIGDTWNLNHADGEKRARKDERDRLLALKRRLKARTDHMDEMDDHLMHAIPDASSEEEHRQLIECLKSLGKMRAAQGEVEKHVDGIIEDTIEEDEADPHVEAAMKPQAGHLNVTTDDHTTWLGSDSTGSDSYSTGSSSLGSDSTGSGSFDKT